jgi:hypothetical protein
MTGVQVTAQISYRNILDTITKLCEAAEVGFKTVFNPLTRIFTFTLYQGAVSQAVFSREYENLTEQIYTQNDSDYANTALVGGGGEGTDRMFIEIESGAGENRHEVYVDARDMQEEDYDGDYAEALTYRGQTKLSEMNNVQSFDATVNALGNLTYKVDFDLGQTVQVVSKQWGVILSTRISEIEESYDASGLSLNVVFGRGLLTLAQRLKGEQ